jgi:chloramphenicol 3-O-phosphotransferase
LKNQVFIINGSGTSGKDSFVQLAQEIFNKNFNVYNISSVTKIKQALRLLG